LLKRQVMKRPAQLHAEEEQAKGKTWKYKKKR
jgi:hypothetical protein